MMPLLNVLIQLLKNNQENKSPVLISNICLETKILLWKYTLQNEINECMQKKPIKQNNILIDISDTIQNIMSVCQSVLCTGDPRFSRFQFSRIRNSRIFQWPS